MSNAVFGRLASVALLSLGVLVLGGRPAAADPAMDGIEKVSKKEAFSAADTDAFVVFRYEEIHRFVGLPDFVWAAVDLEAGEIRPYERKSLGGVDIGRALTAGGLVSGLRKEKPKYYAFRIPAGAHAICEVQVTRPTSAYYEPHSLKYAAPAFEFAAGKVNFIGEISLMTKSIVTMSEGSGTILIEDTGILAAHVRGERDLAGAEEYVRGRFKNVSAEFVSAPVSYVDLTARAEGPYGFARVEKPLDVSRDSAEYAEYASRPRGSRPECLPLAE